MATKIKASYSTEVQDKLSRYDTVKAEAEVVFQSVAPGTTIRRGETVNVRLISSSDVPLHDLVKEGLPERFTKLTLADLDDVGGDPEIIGIIKDPAKLKDPTERIKAKNSLEKSLNTNLSEQEADAMFGIVGAVF
ncbi:MAG TPA: PASTA domain-containing protein [Polyangiaceae bacterium]|nr:PASTA domain-containing protein [Polyangiaceae bacterium]